AAQPVLQNGRGNVLAAGGDDDVLLAAGDGEVAVLVEGAEVAGGEPAVVEHLVRGLPVAPVLPEDDAALDTHLPVVGDPHRGAGHRESDGAGARAQRR